MRSFLVASGLLLTTLLAACAGVGTPANTAPKETLTRVAESKILTLGFREDSKPFSFKDGSGNPTGYSVDLCKGVAASLRSQLKLPQLDLKWVPVTVATRVQAVRDGTKD